MELEQICLECGRKFTISEKEQAFYQGKNYVLPKRCSCCRKKRRKEKLKLLKKSDDAPQKESVPIDSILADLPYGHCDMDNLVLTKPVHTLFVIGNGFDIAHGVKSSYWDFQKTLGKNSDLRFFVEVYLRNENLWYQFEESLSCLDVGMMLESIDGNLRDFGVYDDDDSMAAFHGAIDTAMLPIEILCRDLPRRFSKWVDGLTSDGSRPMKDLLLQDALYLNFNYTDFLETLYGISSGNICYLHGKRRRKKGKPSKLILGHKPNVDYLSGRTLNHYFVPKYKDPWKRQMLQYALETAKNQWVSFYSETFTKHTTEILQDHKSFFEKIQEVNTIVVLGHSLGQVDDPYFQELNTRTSRKAAWKISYHTGEDLKRIDALVKRLHLINVTIFKC